jgi:glycosyltransferase involved in cell wall biosynthesis
MYKVSIVTVNLNNAPGLEKTIESVIGQTYADIEYIVIDGASTDGSLDIIRKYELQISYWISEADRGVYNAMNKGIRVATGDYLLFLNSGDCLFANDVINQAMICANGESILYGNLVVQEDYRSWVKTYPDMISLLYLIEDSLPHPSSFFKQGLFEQVGRYNENLRIVSDWEFYTLAIVKHQVSFKHVDVVISVFSFDGMSSKKENQHAIELEKTESLKANFKYLYEDLLELIRLKRTVSKVRHNRFIKILRFFGALKVLD